MDKERAGMMVQNRDVHNFDEKMVLQNISDQLQEIAHLIVGCQSTSKIS